ncbi:MAG: hypothetical protein U5P10_01885 [Spirochaetia bacterium]|nr:hypothetical protein [Spirochaetia bacterium]
MKTTTMNRKIEQLLLSLHTEAVGSSNYAAAVDELKNLITSPYLYRDDTKFKLPEGMAEESIIVSDALESVTNGMYNPEVLNRLQEITGDSPFYPWKNAVLSILSYYQSDRDNMLQLLEQIPAESPPAVLKPILLHLSRVDTATPPASCAHDLIEAVREDRAFLQSAVEQLSEYLEDQLEEAFNETAMLLVQDLLPSYPQAARRLALWSMQTAAEQEHDLSFILGRFKIMFGEVEGLRLTAIALQSIEPDISILFWLRYAIGNLASGLVTQTELAALLSLIADIIQNFQRDDTYLQLYENREYSRGLTSLVKKLYDEVQIHLQEVDSPLDTLFQAPTPPQDAYSWLNLLVQINLTAPVSLSTPQAQDVSRAQEETESSPPAIGTETAQLSDPAQDRSAPRQLELF